MAPLVERCPTQRLLLSRKFLQTMAKSGSAMPINARKRKSVIVARKAKDAGPPACNWEHGMMLGALR
jgi:hypothetical protein